MKNESYKIRAGWGPNPVFDTAKAYLDVAEDAYSKEVTKTGFLEFSNWFVVHHLSVISTELFLKSFNVMVSHSPVTDGSGPSHETVEHAYDGHQTKLHKLNSRDADGLKDHLHNDLFKLLVSVSCQSKAKFEIGRGRYPYENDGGSPSFPDGEEGQALATNWLNLARALSKYKGAS